jgi:hypothetical protein
MMKDGSDRLASLGLRSLAEDRSLEPDRGSTEPK